MAQAINPLQWRRPYSRMLYNYLLICTNPLNNLLVKITQSEFAKVGGKCYSKLFDSNFVYRANAAQYERIRRGGGGLIFLYYTYFGLAEQFFFSLKAAVLRQFYPVYGPMDKVF